jgi:hypothetical protein
MKVATLNAQVLILDLQSAREKSLPSSGEAGRMELARVEQESLEFISESGLGASASNWITPWWVQRPPWREAELVEPSSGELKSPRNS